MAESADLYNTSYGNYGLDVYRDVRVETYGEDLGQTSWVTWEESQDIPRLLELGPDCDVLEIGCGSGRYALYVTERVGCRTLGLDLNAEGVRVASELCRSRGLDRARFERRDVSEGLPAADASFDAVFSNDVLCHIHGRPGLFREVWRALRPGGRFLFSDALVINGMLSSEEIATRSSIGYYEFMPVGMNERLLSQAGFRDIRAVDTTARAAELAGRWEEARARRRDALVAVEGAANFEGLQRFLSSVRRLTRERRLCRYVYLAQRGHATS